MDLPRAFIRVSCYLFRSVRNEWYELYGEATQLGRFEYKWLDMDGGTTGLEHELRNEGVVLKDHGKAVDTKYQHLVPIGYDAMPLGIFEYSFSGENGNISQLEEELWSGNDVFTGCPD